MFPEKKTKKLLPCGAFKRQVFKMYPKTPEKTLREDILYCQQMVYPHKSEEELKNKQWLNRKVLKKIVEIHDAPEGYLHELD